jgi:signal transduction histidine kinase/DNA-binding response OmpR family regulator
MQPSYKKKRLTLDRKIYAVFFLIIGIAMVNVVVSSWVATTNRDRNEYINSVIRPSLDALHELHTVIIKSKAYVINWIYLQNARPDQAAIDDLHTVVYPRLKRTLEKLAEQSDDAKFRTKLQEVFSGFEQQISRGNEVFRLLSTFNDYQDPVKRFMAEEIVETEIVPLSETVSQQLEAIVRDKQDEATIAQNNIMITLSALVVLVLGLSSLIIISILAVVLFMSSSILGPMMKMREVILKMSRGEFPNLNFKRPKNAVGETIDSLSLLLESMKRTSEFARMIGQGNFDSEFEPLSENDVQGKALLEMRSRLKQIYEAEQARHWIAEGLTLLNTIIQKYPDNLEQLTSEFSTSLVQYCQAVQAAVFIHEKTARGDDILKITGGFACGNALVSETTFPADQGLIGQCFSSREKIRLTRVDENLFVTNTGLSALKPSWIKLVPLVASGRTLGVLEISGIQELSPRVNDLVDRVSEHLAMAIFSVQSNAMTRRLLEETIKQADDLAAQKQELNWMNQDLIKKSKALELSQEELKAQQEELKQMNLELEMKAHLLQEQNIAIENARQALSLKAQQLEKSSQYKSSFLANMSHELRTPLNSILILAKMLSENKSGNLTEKQVEHARVIHKSGSDLLTLINDILDLSKIEAGKMELNMEWISISEILTDMETLFSVLANEKRIQFTIEKEQGLPENIRVDKVRFEQVLKNLLSNAFKFTPASGRVSLQVCRAEKDAIYRNQALYSCPSVIAFKVSDTGIGIPEDKQKLVFEAFQQADGSTSRRYGGTGLGLAISRELCQMMGCEISLYSVEGSGSTFTVYVPCHTETVQDENNSLPSPGETRLESEYPEPSVTDYVEQEISDDRQSLHPGDRIVVIVEDDIPFLRTLMDIAHECGFKAVGTIKGDRGLQMIYHFKPSLILLDLKLPVMDGWNLLKKIKSDASIASIPVYIISAIDKKSLGLQLGATGYITKPAERSEILKIFSDIHADQTALVSHSYQRVQSGNSLQADAEVITVSSPPSHPDILRQTLKGKRILMVDDDMRNIYSLSAALENEGLQVSIAYDGKQALDMLAAGQEYDLILMDIMMPVMDGYTAIREIRKNDRFKNLPILALTAKAMKDDRQKCLDAGATDYLSKPVNVDQLFSLMGAWLYK